jgi:hypothetical protein
LPSPQRADEEVFAQAIDSLNILPRRPMDDKTGKLFVKWYRAKLRGFSNDALRFLVARGLERFQFYPTIAECLEILRAWPNAEIATNRRHKAKHLIQREMNTRMDEDMELLRRRLLSDEQVNRLPPHIVHAGWTKAYLWKFTDGTFAVRPDILAMPDAEAEAARAWFAANTDRIVLA